MQHETRCHIRLLAACSCLTTNTRSCCELPSAPSYPAPPHSSLQRHLLLLPSPSLAHHHHHQHCCCLVATLSVAALHIIDSKLSTLPELSEAKPVGKGEWRGLSHLAITSVWTWPLPAIKWHTLSRNAFVCCPESEIYAILDTSCVPKGI